MEIEKKLTDKDQLAIVKEIIKWGGVITDVKLAINRIVTTFSGKFADVTDKELHDYVEYIMSAISVLDRKKIANSLIWYMLMRFCETNNRDEEIFYLNKIFKMLTSDIPANEISNEIKELGFKISKLKLK